MTSKPQDGVRRLILDTLDRLGVSLNDCSRRMGMNTAYMHQFIYRGSPKKLDEDKRRQLAAITGLDERLLISDNESVADVSAQGAPPSRPLRGRAGLRDLPLWRASTEGEIDTRNDDMPDAFVPRLEALLGNSKAWACRVVDRGLAPCLSIGDTAFFDPLDPAQPGDIVCLVQATPTGMERRLGICRGVSRSEIALSGHIAGANEMRIELQPHMQIGRFIGMLRR
jgi:hypothetical protein